jgi:hypothetical protein
MGSEEMEEPEGRGLKGVESVSRDEGSPSMLWGDPGLYPRDIYCRNCKFHTLQKISVNYFS